MKKYIALGVVVLLVQCLFFAAESKAQGCNIPPKDFRQGEQREYRGLYENKAYGYSVTIPANLVGYDDANPFYQHGFGIAFGKEPRSYLFVNGEPNSLEFAHPAEAASNDLKHLRKHGDHVKSSKITESQLGQLKAVFLLANYTCPGSSEVFVRASMLAISPNRSKLYEITLYARADRFQDDRSVLDALVRSWKLLDEPATASHGF